MKILYAIQGTGNGHLARAYDIYPALCELGAVDILVSGIQGDIPLPFPVKYQLYGLSFIFGKKGGVNKWETVRRMKLGKLLKDIFRLPVKDYDVVINDFEAVSAWACKLRHHPCISLSHQSAVLHPNAPKPLRYDWLGDMILKYYAPVSERFGFHFQSFDEQTFTPIIRKQIREAAVIDKGHYTVYLPAYDDNSIIKELSAFESIHWEVFSKHCKEAFTFKQIKVQPINNDAFIKSMVESTGVLCGAGFETPAEALYMGKKLLVIPMQGQYEQQCNAACLASLGVPVIDSLHKKHKATIAEWIDKEDVVVTDYPDNTKDVVAKVMAYFYSKHNSEFSMAS